MKLRTTELNRFFNVMAMLTVAAVLVAMPDAAHAAGGGGLPWEGPLDKLKDSLTGPVALAISLIAIVIAGATLVFGSEIDGFARKMIVIVLVIALIVAANNVLSGLFGASTATIAMLQPVMVGVA